MNSKVELMLLVGAVSEHDVFVTVCSCYSGEMGRTTCARLAVRRLRERVLGDALFGICRLSASHIKEAERC